MHGVGRILIHGLGHGEICKIFLTHMVLEFGTLGTHLLPTSLLYDTI